MRFSIRQLFLTTWLLALILAMGIPAGRFLFYDKVNFEYDQQQAGYYIRDISGVRGDALKDAFDQMNVWNRNEIFIASAIESPSEFKLEWITANPRLPDRMIAALDSGLELSFIVSDVGSTSSVSYFADVKTDDRISSESSVRCVRIYIGDKGSEECVVQPLRQIDGGYQ
jgi:hypothetical protein